MKFYTFTTMSYPYLPDDYEGDAWVTCSNELYDPERGTEHYRNIIDLLEYAEELGFDGVGVNEHHQTAYSLSPSPNLIASIIARTTKQVEILVLGNALPLYDPLRTAEEFAMIDVISGGRLIAGFVVGDQPGYYSYNRKPTEARARYNEAVDFLLTAWTTPGPFEYNGQFYRYRFANPWPRPVQQPHPPVWIPGIGSVETMEFCAQRGFTYVSLPFFHRSAIDHNYSVFKKAWREAGREDDPSKLGLLTPVYVADTDAQARAEFEEHFWYFRRLQKGIFPNAPGYTSERSVLRMAEVMRTRYVGSTNTWQDLVDGGYVVAGSPDTVTEQLTERIELTGAGNLLTFLQLGSLPYELARKNHQMFAEEVMPKLQKEFPDGPKWSDA